MAGALAARVPAPEVALVTGGSQGLGFAAARALAAAGARIAIVGRDPKKLAASRRLLEDEFGRPTLSVQADLARVGAARRIVAKVLGTLGRIDTVVAAAGDVPVGSVGSLGDRAWRKAMDGKLLGHVAIFREVKKHLCRRGQGLIIALTGATGFEPSPGNAAAGAVNAALQNVMKALAGELGPAGIRVVCISPGPFLTDRLRHIARATGKAASDAAVARRFSKDVPLGRVGDAAELGALVQFLHSPQAGFLNGTTIVMDGGKRRSAA